MAEPVRHRQTKEAATDMFDLQPPRHIPTLPILVVLTVRRSLPVYPDKQTFSACVGMSQTCQKKTFRLREFYPVSDRTADILLVRFVPKPEVPSLHSIISSAVDSGEGGTDRPRALARLPPDYL
jgi:hypothetical protein